MKTLALAVMLAAAPAAPPPSTVMKTVPATLDPATGYILVRMGERAPDLWNVLQIAPYDPVLQDIRGEGRAKGNPVAKGADRTVSIGTKPFVAEGDHVRTYLVAVTPGLYVVQGGPTTCFCLGSYQFEVAAGRITDMGTIYIGPENGSSPWAALKPLRSTADIEERAYTVAEAMQVLPWRDSMSLPPGVSGLAREPARYTVAARFGNHAGQLLNRALPIEAGQ
jgi:hypothetical protein